MPDKMTAHMLPLPPSKATAAATKQNTAATATAATTIHNAHSMTENQPHHHHQQQQKQLASRKSKLFPKLTKIGGKGRPLFLFSKRKREKQEKKQRGTEYLTPFDSPPRPKHMPREIHLLPQPPNGSPMSQVSGATGLDDRIPFVMGQSLFQSSLLPTTSSSSFSLSDAVTGDQKKKKQQQQEEEDSEEHASLQSYMMFRDHDVSVPLGGSGRNLKLSQQRRTSAVVQKEEGAGDSAKRILFAPIQNDWNVKNEQHNRNKKKTKWTSKSIILRSKWFERLVSYVFDLVDVDQSGKICKKELYAGLILVHLKLAAYIGPAACRPASREYVEEVFDTLDVDGSGFLSRKEFRVAMTIFCSQIVSRVLVQIVMTLMIVPCVAKYMLEFWNDFMTLMNIIVMGIRDAEFMSHRLWVIVGNVLNCIVPAGIKVLVLDCKSKVVEYIPSGVVDALPLTIISCMLSATLVPWMLFQVDDLYHKLASMHRIK